MIRFAAEITGGLVEDYPDLQRGSKGEWVSYLQGLLSYAGYSTGGVDEVFGHRTEDAVRSYQKAFHLDSDGIVGPKTWGQLTWTWDWAQFPVLAHLRLLRGDGRAILASIGLQLDEPHTHAQSEYLEACADAAEESATVETGVLAVAALMAIDVVQGTLKQLLEHISDQHQRDALAEYLGHWQQEQHQLQAKIVAANMSN